MIGMTEIEAFTWIKSNAVFWRQKEVKAMRRDPEKFGHRICAQANHGWVFMDVPTATKENNEICKNNFAKAMKRFNEEYK